MDRGLRWLPVTDPVWLTAPEIVEATLAGVDDGVPWFDPTDERWWPWNPRFLLLPVGQQEALLAAARDPDAPGWEVRRARLAGGVLVWFTCGRPGHNLVVVDPVGAGERLLRRVDALGLPVGVPVDGVCLVPVDYRWAPLVCSGSLVVVLADGGGRFPWDPDARPPAGPVLWDQTWRPELVS